jgi:hypothetical protein
MRRVVAFQHNGTASKVKGTRRRFPAMMALSDRFRRD